MGCNFMQCTGIRYSKSTPVKYSLFLRKQHETLVSKHEHWTTSFCLESTWLGIINVAVHSKLLVKSASTSSQKFTKIKRKQEVFVYLLVIRDSNDTLYKNLLLSMVFNKPNDILFKNWCRLSRQVVVDDHKYLLWKAISRNLNKW